MALRFSIEKALLGEEQAEINAAARKARTLLRGSAPDILEATVLYLGESYLHWGTAPQDEQLQRAQEIEAVSAGIHTRQEGKKNLRPVRI